MTKKKSEVISAREAQRAMADAVNRVVYGNERVILARRGKNLAALVSMDDLATLEQLEEKIRFFKRMQDIKSGLPVLQAEHEVAQALAAGGQS